MRDFVFKNVTYYSDGIFERGDIYIKGGKIASVGNYEPNEVHHGYEVIDASRKICLPGFVNAHTHSHNILARGTLGASSLEVLIGNIDAANKGRTPEEAYDAAVLNAIESIRGGATAVVDMFTTYPLSREHIDAVGEAYRDVGVRALIAAHYTDLSSFEPLPGFVDSLTPTMRESIAHLLRNDKVNFDIVQGAAEAWHGAYEGRITFGLAPTVPQQCSDSVLEMTGVMAEELGIPVHTHLAESRTETVTSQVRFEGKFVERLIELGVLGEGNSAAHGVWLGRKDLDRLAASGTILVHCPSSNLRLGAGVARTPEWRRAGIEWTLGSDGAVSSDNLNIFSTMKLAALSSRIWGHDTAEWLTAQDVLEHSFSGKTRTLGSQADLRGIHVGADADLTLLSTENSYLSPQIDFANLLVFSETGQSVSDVIVDGEFVMKDCTIQAVDESEAIRRVNQAGRQLLVRNEVEWQTARELRQKYDEVNARTSNMVWRPNDDRAEDWSPQDLVLPF